MLRKATVLHKGLLAVVVIAAFAVGPASASAATTSVDVQATSGPADLGGTGYTDSGVTLAAGQQVEVTASGTWCAAAGFCFGPEGAGFPAGGGLAPTAAAGSLVASLDGGVTWQEVGAGPVTLTGPGTILLAFNDGLYGDNSGSVTVTIAAKFDLTVSTSGTGSGQVISEPVGIECETGSAAHPDCSETFVDGDSVTLTANPAAGSEFSGWSGGGCSDASPTCTVTMDQARSVDAAFALDEPPVDEPPVIISLEVAPRTFKPVPQPMERMLGAAIEIELSERADVRFHVRRDPLRRSGRPATGARVFNRGLDTGVSSLPFSGTFQKTLKPGRYQVIAVATDSAGQRSEKARAGFRIAS